VVTFSFTPEQYKEEHLCRLPRHAHERGLALLLVDLPGQGQGQGQGQEQRGSRGVGIGRYDIETAISGWVDFLAARRDVQARKIGILGEGLGASFATRGASFDNRFAAAVCDAGIWDLHERAFLASRLGGDPLSGEFGSDVGRLCRGSLATRIECPILVAFGEHDWLQADRVRQCCEALSAAGHGIDLKIFSAAETAASPAQFDNPTIASEFIFDWIADRLA
jgi:dienelactone hydrolase